MRHGRFTTAWVSAVGGIAGVLFSINAGLQLFVLQAHGRVSLATMLLVLHLAAWSCVLGLVGLVLLSAWWINGELRLKPSRVAMGDASIVGPKGRQGRHIDDSTEPFVKATRARTAI